jgi:hypothetical protein
MSSYSPNHAGVSAMLNADWMEDAMRVRAEEIKTRAMAMAPGPSERDIHPGRYKASFHVRSHKYGGVTGRGGRRAEAIVYNDAPEAIFVEYGHHGREPYHTLANAAFVRIRRS